MNKKWLDDPTNAIPAEYSTWGGFTKLDDEGLLKQIQLVKDLKNQEFKNEEETKISAIWEASNARFQAWANDTATCDPISRELEILDAILPFHVQDQGQCQVSTDTTFETRLAEYFYYTQVNGIGNVFDFDSGSDLENANNVVLDFVSTGFSLPSREYYFDPNFTEKCEQYKTHLQNVANIINSNSSVNLDPDFAQNVFDFEKTLANYMMKSEQARRYDEYYTRTTITDIHQKIDDLKSIPDKYENYTQEENQFQLNSSQRESIKVFLEKV